MVSRICAINSSWWLNHPSKKISYSQIESFPQVSKGENKEIFETTTQDLSTMILDPLSPSQSTT